MRPVPPKFAQQFFSWYCKNELHDSILGDLEEKFLDDVKKFGILRAKLNYWWSVLGFINRFTLKRDHSIEIDNRKFLPMTFMHIKSSLRFLQKNKGFAMINISGLTIGLTSCLLILYFINHETSFDDFNQNKNNIYRINMSYEDNSGNINKLVNSPPALAPGINGLFPELKKVTRMRYAMRCLLSNRNDLYYENHGYYADSLFLEIFDYELISEDPNTALDEPNTIVITKEMAAKLFREAEPMGSTIMLNNMIPLKVTGVIESVPSNSHLDFEFLISFATYVVPDGYASNIESWRWMGFLTYAELHNNSDPSLFEHKLVQLFVEKNPAGRKPLKPMVQGLSDIYLGSQGIVDDLASNIRSGNEFNLNILMIIAILILVIAGFNFTNLTSAISINRGKATGIRKVLGANSSVLRTQLLGESILISILCMFIAYGLSVIAFRFLGSWLGWDIELSSTVVLNTVPYILPITLFLGLLSGFYPALMLSKISIIPALKGQLKHSASTPFNARNILVMVQFGISIMLISATIVITKQLDHIQNHAIGVEKENVALVQLLPEDMTRYFDTFKDRLSEHSSILGISTSERVIGDPWPINSIRRIDQDRSESKIVSGNLVGQDYFETLGIDVIQGRTFSTDYATDSTNAIILNEAAVAHLGLENPIGEQVYFFSMNGPRTIIGVVEDFNFATLHHDIGPAVMILPFIDLEYMYIRLAPGELLTQIELLESTWQAVSDGTPLEIKFLDDRLNQLYHTEQRLSLLLTGFSIFAIFLACLGLYGLITFMINNRIKEVGVRKVLGASGLSLYVLFVKQYVFQVLIAASVVIPFLHHYLNRWLTEFAYRIELQWWIYPSAAITLMGIALLTLTHQVIRATRTNPVNVLRNE